MVTCVVIRLVTHGLPNGYVLNMKYQVNVWLCIWLHDGYMLVTCILCDKKNLN